MTAKGAGYQGVNCDDGPGYTPTSGGRAPRIYYVTQAEVAPPLFVVQSSDPESIHFSYQRYVINQIRKAFGFEGVPVRVRYKARRRRE